MPKSLYRKKTSTIFNLRFLGPGIFIYRILGLLTRRLKKFSCFQIRVNIKTGGFTVCSYFKRKRKFFRYFSYSILFEDIKKTILYIVSQNIYYVISNFCKVNVEKNTIEKQKSYTTPSQIEFELGLCGTTLQK